MPCVRLAEERQSTFNFSLDQKDKFYLLLPDRDMKRDGERREGGMASDGRF